MDKKGWLNEDKTRKTLIDKELEKRGWNLNDDRQVAQEYLIRFTRAETSEVINDHWIDYLFFDNVGDPLAIVEAKRYSRNAYEGKKQAEEYADFLKRKTGKDCFIFLTNGEDILFWDRSKYPPRKVMGFFSQSELMRRRQQNESKDDLATMKTSNSIIDRPYQIQTVKKVTEGITKGKRKFLLVLATGTGKTRISMALIDMLLRAGKAQKILFLTDRTALRDQAFGDIGDSGFKQFFPNESKKKILSGNFDENARLYASTIQTMVEIYKDISPGYFDVIFSDEAHRSIYGKWNEMLSYFDAFEIGLTATPAEAIDKNTFRQFDCFDGTPTINFSYDEALNSVPPYLAPFRVLMAQTNFQMKGIKPGDIPLEVRKKYIEQGIPLEDLSFEGTDIGKSVINKGTDDAIVREFMEVSLKDQAGVHPGKSIIFAINKRHAQGLLESFNRLYPDYHGELAETIYSGMERVSQLIKDFTMKDFPRVAISVDMLDTGVDIPEVVNLVFAKPVFSKIKFWQMIGRGTRPNFTCKHKDRLPDGKKEYFLIIDHWKNFQYFNLNPEGKKEYLSEALPVKLFKTKLKKLKHFLLVEDSTNVGKSKSEIENMIKSLPKDSITIKENRRKIEHVFEGNFWDNVAENPADYIDEQIAPLFRYQSNVVVEEAEFQLKTQQLGLAILQNDQKAFKRLEKSIANDINDLPDTLKAVKEKAEDKRKVLSEKFWKNITYEDADYIENTFTPIMKNRSRDPRQVIELDIEDIIAQQKMIKKISSQTSDFVKEYRRKVEEAIRQLAADNPTISRIMKGEEVSDEEIMDLENSLISVREDFTIDMFRNVFKQPQGTFVQFIRHILRLYEFPSFEEDVSSAFDAYIIERSDFTSDQIQFLKVIKHTLAQRGKLEVKDLYEPPFTSFGTGAVSRLFKEEDIEDIMMVCRTLERRYNVIK